MNISSFIADNWYWIVAAAASGGMLLWQQVKSGGVGGGVTPAQAVQLINKQKAQVIDVCEPAEFAAAHVTGAKNIPLGQLGEGKGLPSNKAIPLVVVCAGVLTALAGQVYRLMSLYKGNPPTPRRVLRMLREK